MNGIVSPISHALSWYQLGLGQWGFFYTVRKIRTFTGYILVSPPPFFLFLFSTSYSALRTTATLIRKYNNFSERNTSSRQPVEESYPNVADDRSVPQSGSMSFAGRGQPRDRPQTSAPLPPNGHGHGQPATAEYFPHLLHRICLSTWKTGHITPGCPALNLTTYCTLTVRVPWTNKKYS